MAKSTVEKSRLRSRKPPSPTWKTLLTTHAKDLVALDFFEVRAPSPMAVSWGTSAADTRSTLCWIGPVLNGMPTTEAHRAGTALRLAPTMPALSPMKLVSRGPSPLPCSAGSDAFPGVPHARHHPRSGLCCHSSAGCFPCSASRPRLPAPLVLGSLALPSRPGQAVARSIDWTPPCAPALDMLRSARTNARH